MDREPMWCGFCGGRAVWQQDTLAWEHAEDGERVKRHGPGDFVSDRHNRKGTKVLAEDLVGSPDDL